MRTSILFIGSLAAILEASGLKAAMGDRERTRPLDPNERICENIIVTGSRIARGASAAPAPSGRKNAGWTAR